MLLGTWHGESSNIWHYNGKDWRQQQTRARTRIFGIHGSEGVVRAVGDDGIIIVRKPPTP